MRRPTRQEKNQTFERKNKDQNKRKLELKEYRVSSSCELMDFLLKTLPKTSRNNVKSLLSHKLVMVDGSVVSQYNFMLSKGDIVQISKTPIKVQEKLTSKKTLNIIYEDDDFIVINKPSGLLSIASDKEKDVTAYRMVMDYVRAFNPRNRVYVVHRIDKDTSGVLMFSKDEKLKNDLQDSWNDLVSKRGYYAVVEGKLDKKQGTYRSWLRETRTNIMYSSHTPGDGQEAVTHYKVMKENMYYSLVDVHIDSGRKNQIRVHMMDLGHKIVGDTKYGANSNPLKRLGLHAYELEITHPYTKKVMNFKSNVPSTFTSLFNKK